MIIRLLLAFVIPSVAAAFTPKEIVNFEIKDAQNFCSTIRKEYKSVTTKPINAERAREFFGVCNVLSRDLNPEVLDALDKTLKTGGEEAVGQLMALEGGSCTSECIGLARELLQNKVLTKKEALRFICKNKIPSKGLVGRELNLLELGEKNKLWKFDDAQTKKIAKIRADFKKWFADEQIPKEAPEDYLVKDIKADFEFAKPYHKETREICQQLSKTP